MIMDKEPLVYLNGEMMPASKAHIAIYDASVVLGATVTDLERTFRHSIFKLEEHIGRFYRSCKYARLKPPVQLEHTKQIIEELVEYNTQWLDQDQELACIQFISPGEFKIYAGAAGSPGGVLEPTYCIHTFPLPFSVWKHYFLEGVHVITPSTRHIPPQCVDPKIKCRSRMHWWLADQETYLVDPKAVALCLDLEGNVTETGGSNFLILRDGEIWTPTTRNILHGISMHYVKELAEKSGFEFRERDFQVYDVINAEEAFLASTPYCLAPVTQINGIPIGKGKPGPVFEKLITLWSDKVGLDVKEQILNSTL
tara:strand:+ start:785 stop:1717 length:933 start_codon:yes stop_codon:yes gene_type:complete